MNHNSIQFNISNIYDWSVKGWHFLDLIDSTTTYQYHYLCSCATHSLARSMRMFLQFLVWRWTSSSRWRSHLTVILINKTNNQGEIQLSFFCFKSTARSRYLREVYVVIRFILNYLILWRVRLLSHRLQGKRTETPELRLRSLSQVAKSRLRQTHCPFSFFII